MMPHLMRKRIASAATAPGQRFAPLSPDLDENEVPCALRQLPLGL
jgi:hypothetical protein